MDKPERFLDEEKLWWNLALRNLLEKILLSCFQGLSRVIFQGINTEVRDLCLIFFFFKLIELKQTN